MPICGSELGFRGESSPRAVTITWHGQKLGEEICGENIPGMQYYQSLQAAVVICDTLVNIHIRLLSSYTISSEYC